MIYAAYLYYLLLLSLASADTIPTCNCSEYSKEECSALSSKRCRYDDTTSKCIQTDCVGLDQPTCTRLSSCYWGGQTPKCNLRLPKCSDYTAAKDCQDAGCWYDQEMAVTKFVCQTPKQCSDYTESCPPQSQTKITCFKKGTLCLDNTCSNYDKTQCENECGKLYKFVDTSCVKKTCAEIDADNCKGAV
jgi:hypothetical protein